FEVITLLRLTLVSCALCACATPTATSAELNELRAAVRALREDNARLEAKINRLDQQKAIAQAPSSPVSSKLESRPSATAPATASATPAEVPALTVVKLKPKKEAAPKINTEVEVLEPSPEVVAAMKKIEAENRGEPS